MGEYSGVLMRLYAELPGQELPAGIALNGTCNVHRRSETLDMKHGTNGAGTVVGIHGNYFFAADGRPANGNVSARYEDWRSCDKSLGVCHRGPHDLRIDLTPASDPEAIASQIGGFVRTTSDALDYQCRECKRTGKPKVSQY